MKKITAIMTTMLFCLLSVNLYAAQKDDPNAMITRSCPGCPLFPKLPGYNLCGCGEQESRNMDIEIVKGKTPGTIHVEGKLTQMTYCPNDESASKLSDIHPLRYIERFIKKQGGTFMGKTIKGPKRDVYKLTRDGHEAWIEVWVEKTGDYNYVVTRKGD